MSRISEKIDYNRVPASITSMGIILSLSICVELYILVMDQSIELLGFLVGVLTSLPFLLLLITAIWWFPRGDISLPRYKTVFKWTVGAGFSFLVVNISLMFVMKPETVFQTVGWVRWAIAVGAGTGLAVGYYQAKTVDEAITAERERLRAQEAENREKMLEYLHATLRHEVLNTATVILGNARLVQNEYRDDSDISNRMEEIISNTEEMEQVIEDVRLLLQVTQSSSSGYVINLSNIIIEAVREIDEEHEDVVVNLDTPKNMAVEGSERLDRVFKELIENSIEHSSSSPVTVSIEGDKEDGKYVLFISDDGPGIPEDKQKELFETSITKSSKNMLGLPLIKTLIESHGGEINLLETYVDGAAFRIEFPSV